MSREEITNWQIGDPPPDVDLQPISSPSSQSSGDKKETPAPPSAKLAKYPRCICRVTPFLPAPIPANRDLVGGQEVVHETAYGTTTYTGPQLYCFDETVLLHILRLADSEGIVETSLYHLSLILFERTDGRCYKKITESLKALHRTCICLRSKESTAWKDIHFLEQLEFADKKLRIKINREIAKNSNNVNLNLDVRSRLSDPGKAIYSFLLSHKQSSWTGRLETLINITRIGEDSPAPTRKKLIQRAVKGANKVIRCSPLGGGISQFSVR